ncbi:MAG: type III polyketide synthase [Planctomycetes bacterium]|nr:type III polyketide synthase [Planctomycetota bacterium]
MSFEILGMGTALPEHSIDQQHAAELAETLLSGESVGINSASLVKALYRRSGVQSRHSVVLEDSSNGRLPNVTFYPPSDSQHDRGPCTFTRMDRYEKEAPLLASTAVRKALSDANVPAECVTHLITVSCSGFSAPGVDLKLIQSLGFKSTTSRTHIGFMGCHGFQNGLRVAQAFTSADPEAVVVVCAVELCSLHHQYGLDPQSVVANSLFADGAAAAVGRAARSSAITPSQRLPGRLVESFSCVIPETEDMMTWRIGNTGFQMTLSPEVPDIITRILPGVMEDSLRKHSLNTRDIRSWAIHPGGPRILKACEMALNLKEEDLDASRSVLSRCGNMSSPTVLFVLEELHRRDFTPPCVMLGFGPGLNVEIALLM